MHIHVLPFTTDFILSSTEYIIGWSRSFLCKKQTKINTKNNNEGKKTLNLKERNKTQQIIQQ